MKKVFISYSHKDEAWKDRVMTHLGVLENENILKLWSDRNIGVGADWFPEIERELNNAGVVIMLITANFLTSQFILRNEVPQILQRRETEGILVAPVIVEPCAWQTVQWLSAMQLFPKDGKPLSTLKKPKADSELAKLALVCRDVARNVSTTTASADEFFQETLQWFGDANPEAFSAVDKGRRLARLARQQKTLLILDGLEPLQYPPGEIHGFNGKLKDAGLAAFLKELACGCPGGVERSPRHRRTG